MNNDTNTTGRATDAAKLAILAYDQEKPLSSLRYREFDTGGCVDILAREYGYVNGWLWYEEVKGWEWTIAQALESLMEGRN